MEVIDVVNKLIGDIKPCGRSEVDGDRYNNLIAYCNLITELIEEVEIVAHQYRHSYEFSVKRAGEHAFNFLKEL